MDEGIGVKKRRLREEIRRRTDAMTEEEARASSVRIEAEILASEIWRAASSVFLYVSVGKEPDTRGLIAEALREGKRVCVPKCLPGPERIMLAVRIRSLEELVPGTLGIPEPRLDPAYPAETAWAEEFDLILVPCMTANRRGDRLGHGAGYYDRFLAPLASSGREEKKGPALVCLCHGPLLTEDIPAGACDVRMDAVASGDGTALSKFF